MKQDSPGMVVPRDVQLCLGRDSGREISFSITDFEVGAGDSIALTGPSGCGKSTLLNIISGLRRPDSGSVRVSGSELSDFGEAALDRHRGRICGHVFQSFHLLAPFNALENVMIGLRFAGIRGEECHSRAEQALARVGLANRRNSRPSTLSAGERQRVAIARAIATDPPLLLADEPTGALDVATGTGVFDLLQETTREAGRTLLLVTHDESLAAQLPHRFDCSELISAGKKKGASTE